MSKELKSGDVCYLVNTTGGNDGKIVTVLQFFPQKLVLTPEGERRMDCWSIHPTVPSWLGPPAEWAPVYQLRKIDNPGDDAKDETLEWLPVPSKTTEKENA